MFSRTYYPSTAGSVIVPASAGVYPSYAGSGYGMPAYGGSYYGGGGYHQTPMVINGSSRGRSSVVVSQPMSYPAVPHSAVPYGYGGYGGYGGFPAQQMPYYGAAAPTVVMTSSSSSSGRRHRRHSHSHHRSRSHSRSRFFDF
jgi:hypothetical protein